MKFLTAICSAVFIVFWPANPTKAEVFDLGSMYTYHYRDGRYADWGDYALHGARIAIDEINSTGVLGDDRLRLKPENTIDYHCWPANAALMAETLMRKDILALTGAGCSGPAVEIAKMGEKYGVPVISNGAYAADYARRIYLDGREFPDTATSSSFGFSTGEWKGETLVVTTTRLTSAFMSTHGQPVSENAKTIEHFYFDDKGYLHADMWLHDPVNYERPPFLRRVYDRDFSPSVITKVDCDPFTFFRALYLEDDLEEFWNRANFRR